MYINGCLRYFRLLTNIFFVTTVYFYSSHPWDSPIRVNASVIQIGSQLICRPSKAFEHYVRKRLGRGSLFFAKACDSATCRKIFCSPSARPCALSSSQKAFSARLSFDFSEVFEKKTDFVNNLSLINDQALFLLGLSISSITSIFIQFLL